MFDYCVELMLNLTNIPGTIVPLLVSMLYDKSETSILKEDISTTHLRFSFGCGVIYTANTIYINYTHFYNYSTKSDS